MSTKIQSLLTVLAVVSLFAVSSVDAGILENHPLAYNNGLGPGPGGSWTGSDIYDNGLAPPNQLIGDIDFSVFTVANFNAAFPGSGYVPGAGDSLIYAYQLENQGDFFVSAQIVGISSIANAIGSFDHDPNDQTPPVEIAPGVSTFDAGGNAVWLFSLTNIGTNEDSTILVYSSPNIPTLGTAVGTTVNGGTVGISTVPTPSSTPIPEPAAIALLGAGLIGLISRRRRK